MRVGGNDEQQIGERVPIGVQVVALAAVFDIGLQRGFEDKIQHKVVLWFESQHKDTKGRPFTIPTVVTASSNEKSTMAAVFGALSGAAPTDEECQEGFDLDDVIGKCCFVNMAPPKKAGGWPYIATYMPMPAGMPAVTVSDKWEGPNVPKFVEKMREKQIAPPAVVPAVTKAAPAAKAVKAAVNPITDVDVDAPPF